MQRHKGHRAVSVVHGVYVGYQGDVFQKCPQRILTLGKILLNFFDIAYQFPEVIHAGLHFASLILGLEVSLVFQRAYHAPCKLGKWHGAAERYEFAHGVRKGFYLLHGPRVYVLAGQGCHQHGLALLLCHAGKLGYGRVAYAALWHVDYAFQGYIVKGIVYKAQIRHYVLYFLALIEALAAVDLVGYAVIHHGSLRYTALGIHAVQHCEIAVVHSVAHALHYLAAYEMGLVPLAVSGEGLYPVSPAVIRPELLALAALIILYYGVCGVQYI